MFYSVRVIKILLAIGITGFLVIVGVQVFRLNSQRLELQAKVEKITTQVVSLKKENTALEADLEYVSDPANLIKEFKKLFNLKAPGEKLYIIVPKEPH